MKYYVATDIGRFSQEYHSLEDALKFLNEAIRYDMRGEKRRVRSCICPVGRSVLYRIECEED